MILNGFPVDELVSSAAVFKIDCIAEIIVLSRDGKVCNLATYKFNLDLSILRAWHKILWIALTLSKGVSGGIHNIFVKPRVFAGAAI